MGLLADLGAHQNEAEGVDSSNQGVQDPAVPALVSLIVQSIDSIARHQRVQHIAEVPDSISIMLLGLASIIVAYAGHNRLLSSLDQSWELWGW